MRTFRSIWTANLGIAAALALVATTEAAESARHRKQRSLQTPRQTLRDAAGQPQSCEPAGTGAEGAPVQSSGRGAGFREQFSDPGQHMPGTAIGELALARQNASILPKGHGYSPCCGLYAEQAHGKWRGPATEPGLCDRCKVKPGIIQYHLAGSWVVVAGRAP